MEGMAEAVEKAAVVVVCLTSKYKDSNSCRTGACIVDDKNFRIFTSYVSHQKPNTRTDCRSQLFRFCCKNATAPTAGWAP